jgi:hypothetical protein
MGSTMMALAFALLVVLLVLVELRARASRKRDEALLVAVERLRRDVRRAIPLGVEMDGEVVELDDATLERIDDLADRLRDGHHGDFAKLVFQVAEDDPSKTRH